LSEKIAPRERILTAALSVFAEKGYHRAGVDDIVRASGPSKGGLSPLRDEGGGVPWRG
jgi:AcrR family transcriptional regulator